MIDRDSDDRSIAMTVAAGLQPVREIAETILAQHPYTEEDAMRLARAFLDGQENT